MRILARKRWPEGVLACLVLAAGCDGPMAPPDPPGGGQEFVLDFDQFQSSVAPVLTQYSCNTAECHGGGIRGTYGLSPLTAPDPQFDFEQTRLQVDPQDRLASLMLTEPLEEGAGGTAHPWEPFDGTNHAAYQAILDWILAGELQ